MVHHEACPHRARYFRRDPGREEQYLHLQDVLLVVDPE